MRILHVVPSYLPAWRHGGPIRSVHGLCSALAAHGHRITVFTTDKDIPAELPRAHAVNRDGVEVWYFPLSTLRRIYYAPALARALRATIADYDLVHLHSVFLWPTTAAARAARRVGKPYLLAPRGMLVPDLLRRRGRLRKRLWLALAERRTVAEAAMIHATSDLEARELSRMGLRLPRVVVVPNGIEDDPDDLGAALASEVQAALRAKSIILYLGRLSWKKGLDRLISALPHAPAAHLVLAGPDDEGLRPRLSALAASLEVTDRVRFLGPVAGADRAALLHRSTVVALVSHSENFGNSVLEAMAAGTPVVVTAGVGLAAEVERSGAGLVVSGEPAALGRELDELLAAPERRAGMARAGRAAVRERYSWDRVATTLENIYTTMRP